PRVSDVPSLAQQAAHEDDVWQLQRAGPAAPALCLARLTNYDQASFSRPSGSSCGSRPATSPPSSPGQDRRRSPRRSGPTAPAGSPRPRLLWAVRLPVDEAHLEWEAADRPGAPQTDEVLAVALTVADEPVQEIGHVGVAAHLEGSP